MTEKIFFQGGGGYWWQLDGSLQKTVAEPEDMPLVLRMRGCRVGDRYGGGWTDLPETDVVFWQRRIVSTARICWRGTDEGEYCYVCLENNIWQLALFASISDQNIGWEEMLFLPVSWRVGRERGKLIEQRMLLVRLQFFCHRYGWSSVQIRLRDFVSSSIYLEAGEKKWRFVVYGWGPEGWRSNEEMFQEVKLPEYWQVDNYPWAIDQAVLSLLQDIKGEELGIRPHALSRTKGLYKLAAFMEYPFDLHVVYLHHFFDYIPEREALLAPDNHDCFQAMCRILKIKPPDSLRRAYTFYPYALVAYMLLRQFGFRDINVIQRFYELGRIGSLPLDKLQWNPETGRFQEDYGAELGYWEDFCHYGIALRGESIFSRQLLRISTKVSVRRLEDIINMAAPFFPRLPDNVWLKMVKDQWDINLHDLLVDVTTEMKTDEQAGIALELSEEQKALASTINGCVIRPVNNTIFLRRIGYRMHNCIGGYEDRVRLKLCTICYMAMNDNYLGCIEIRNNAIVQAYSSFNKLIMGEDLKVLLYWAKIKGLELRVNYLEQAAWRNQDELTPERFVVE